MNWAEISIWWSSAKVSFGDVVAGFALALAGYSTWRTLSYSKVQHRLNEALLAEKEAQAKAGKRANVGVVFESAGDIGNYRLLIYNDSSLPARNVRLGESEDNSILHAPDIANKLPFAVLRAAAPISIFAVIYMDNVKNSFVFRVKWEDDYSVNNEETFHLPNPRG